MTEQKEYRVKIPIGPAHPALEEPVRFILEVEGENVVTADFKLGFAHRGIEKLAEKRDYTQTIYLMERVCGICSQCHSSAYTLGVEAIAKAEIPERAEYLRVVLAELERIHSHLLWAGIAGEEIGFNTLMMYSWKQREFVMEALERLTGNRVNYSQNAIGGLRNDFRKEDLDFTLKQMDKIQEAVDYLVKVFTKDPLVHERAVGVGMLTNADAVKSCAIGPTGRASGVATDARKDDPYMAYDKLDWDMIVVKEGDVAARAAARVLEVGESVKIIRQAIKELPDGPVFKQPGAIPAGETISRVEAPRGEDAHYVKTGNGNKVFRERPRAPTEANFHAIPYMLKDAKLADVPIIVASIDPCMSCCDRVAVIENGRQRIVTAKEMRKMK